MKLFNEKERVSPYQGKFSSSPYHVLDESGDHIETKVREFLNTLFESYPEEYQEELASRLRSEIFTSAFFELYIWGLMNACKIPTTPIYENKIALPDFLANKKFYIEATISQDQFHKNSGEERIKNELLDFLEKSISSKCYFLQINLLETSKKHPRFSVIRDAINRRLSQIHKEEQDIEHPSEDIKNVLVEDNGWKILVHIRRIRNEESVNNHRAIGSVFRGFDLDPSRDKLRRTIRSKSNLYKNLQLPLILAINMLTLDCDEEDIMDALFGDLEYLLPNNENGVYKTSRKNNGAWVRNSKYINRRISAIFIINHLNPWTVGTQNATIIHHPYPNFSIPISLLPFNQLIFKEGKIIKSEGEHPRDIFNLPKGWPE